MDLKCSKGHPLVQMTFEELKSQNSRYFTGSQCDKCRHEFFNDDDQVFHCDKCKHGYDLCLECKENINSPPNPFLLDIFIPRCFKEVLGKEPDPADLEFYTQKVKEDWWTMSMVISHFLDSDEFFSMEKTLEEVVRITFHVLLNRDPSPDEIDYWGEYREEHLTKTFIEEFCRHFPEAGKA